MTCKRINKRDCKKYSICKMYPKQPSIHILIHIERKIQKMYFSQKCSPSKVSNQEIIRQRITLSSAEEVRLQLSCLPRLCLAAAAVTGATLRLHAVSSPSPGSRHTPPILLHHYLFIDGFSSSIFLLFSVRIAACVCSLYSARSARLPGL